MQQVNFTSIRETPMPAFNITDIPEAAMLPNWISLNSAWSEHMPMVPVFLKLLQPRAFVELGAYRGDSYMMFCQSVLALSLNTKCTAIDNWRGDLHLGQYPAQIYEDLKAAHDSAYASFSRLLKADFDSALPEFPEKSIDILHIDGTHTYDAVKHDYDSWLPKLSDRGVILFHDTAVHEPSFGVWKLWAEIATPNRPHFNVPYGNGLGILAVGRSVPTRFLDFLAALRSNHQRLLLFYQGLGQRIALLRRSNRLADALHLCQIALNQWRTLHGDPINNPTPNLIAVHQSHEFPQLTLQNLHHLISTASQLLPPKPQP